MNAPEQDLVGLDPGHVLKCRFLFISIGNMLKLQKQECFSYEAGILPVNKVIRISLDKLRIKGSKNEYVTKMNEWFWIMWYFSLRGVFINHNHWSMDSFSFKQKGGFKEFFSPKQKWVIEE